MDPSRVEDSTAWSYIWANLPSAAEHIRLLDVHPSADTAVSDSEVARFAAPIHCDLYTTPISNPKVFKALSYTWGTSRRTHTINLSEMQFSITESLDMAIRYLRKPDEVLTLWIDQICINQDDDVEKTHQIQLMSQIYSKAEQVLVWLGPSADDSDRLMDVWTDVGQQARDFGLESFLTREKWAQFILIWRRVNPTDPATIQLWTLCERARPIFVSCLDAMLAWYKRPWFKRVWVVQEFCLGADTIFVCGQKTAVAELVWLAIYIFDITIEDVISPGSDLNMKIDALCSPPARVLFSARRHRRSYDTKIGIATGHSLFQLLLRLYVEQEMDATDSRDRIFSLLGLATDGLDIVPDYTNHNYGLVFCKTALAILIKDGLELLSYSQFPKNLDGLPSWVPDWRSNLASSYYKINTVVGKHIFDACGGTQPLITTGTNVEILGLNGFTVDVVEEVGSPWYFVVRQRENFDAHRRLLVEIEQMCQKSAAKNKPIYSTRVRREEAVWRVPIGDLDRGGEQAAKTRAYVGLRKGYEALIAHCEFSKQMRLMTLQEFEQQKQALDFPGGSDVYRENLIGMSQKQPFLSRKGYVGMGPVATQPGDVVVIFMGSRIPHVLRPTQGDKFAFMGEAYCDGVMDGELVGTVPQQTFWLV